MAINSTNPGNMATAITRLFANWESFGKGGGSIGYNVLEYGAVGDGVTDDTEAVQAAFAAATDGDTVYFPAGTYTLTTWTVHSLVTDITIVGASMDVTTITGPDTSTSFITFGASGNLVMKDIGFSTWDEVVHGSTENVSYFESYRVKADSVKNYYSDVGFTTGGDHDRFVMRDCKLSNISEYGVLFRSPVTEIFSVTGCEFADSTGSSYITVGSNDETLSNKSTVISGNTFKDLVGTPTTVYGVLVYGNGVVISDNIFNTISGDTGSYSIYTKATRASVIGNSIYDGCNGTTSDYAAIRMKGRERDEAGTTPYGHTNTISGNNVVFSVTQIYNGIKLDTSDITVNANNIDGANGAIICLSGDSVSVANNIINNSYWGVQFRPATAVSDCLIANNVMRNIGAADATAGVIAIYVYSQDAEISNVLISGNLIDTVADIGTTAYGVWLRQATNAMSYLTCIGNIVDTADVGIHASGTITYSTISNNQIQNCTANITAAAYNGTGSTAKNNTGTGDTTIELGHATDTTIARSAAGRITIEDAGLTYTDTVELSSADILDLADTPITLVAGQGADTVIEFVSALLIHDAGTAYVEPSAPDDLVIQYATTGTDVTAAIDSTNFLTVTDDEARLILPTWTATTDLVAEKGNALQLFNTGSDLTTGTGTMTVKVTYRVHTLGL